MRIPAAGLLLAALLVLPTASALDTSLSLSGASAIVDLTSSATQYVPITVGIRVVHGFFCQNDATATVTLTLTSTGPITASLNATSIKFTVPADTSLPVDPGNPGAPNGGNEAVDYERQTTVNLTLARTGAGNGTAGIVASFDGKLDGCTPNPDPADPTATAEFKPSTKSLNVTTQSLVGSTNATPTPTPSTSVTGTPTTPTATTQVSTSPTGPTVGETNPTPTPEETGGKKFLGVPAPGIPLVIAGAVALAVLLRRKA